MFNTGSQPKINWVATALFLLIVPVTAHFLFSWMGMNPSDDGFNLAYSRRILEGEIPHLDFISPRPVGTGLLYVPLVLFGGDYTVWLSRLIVWFQFACIGWLWTVIIGRCVGKSLSLVEQVALAILAFALTAHTFLLSPWPTVDGLWAVSVGLAFCLSQKPRYKFLGYLLVGTSPLFKQNFAVLGPVFIIMLSDWRSIRYWFAFAVPVVAYGIYLSAHHAIPDAVLQLSSHTELFRTGVISYITKWYVYWGLFVAYFGLVVVSGVPKTTVLSFGPDVRRLLGALVLFCLCVAAAACLIWSESASGKFSFVLFGMVAGSILHFALHESAMGKVVKVGMLVMATMWTVSISVGYNFPVLGSGVAFIFLLHVFRLAVSSDVPEKFRLAFPSLLAGMAAITCVCFGIGRSKHIYYDRPASELRYPLDGVLAGGKRINTNPVTYEYMKELQEAVQQLGSREYAIIPDVAIHWVKSRQRNPLPIDWPQDIELSSPALFDRVVQALESERGKRIILAAKVKPFSLASEPEAITEKDVYSIVFYVRNHFQKIGETKYWEFYE